MALHVKATVRFPRVSGLARDEVENTFAFQSADNATALDLGAITTFIGTFYNNSVVGMSHVVGNYLNRSIDRTTQAVIDCYDIDGHLDGSPAGAPIHTQPFTLADPLPGDDNLPDEVAVALSFRAAYGTDVEHGGGGTRPRARDRGRIFVGPLVSDADVVDSAGTFARVSGVIAADLVAAIKNAHDSLIVGAVNTTFAVWSRASASMKPVERYQVDNAFDTQRRRGTDPTAILAVDFPAGP